MYVCTCMVAYVLVHIIAIYIIMYSYEDIFICKQGSFVKYFKLLILAIESSHILNAYLYHIIYGTLCVFVTHLIRKRMIENNVFLLFRRQKLDAIKQKKLEELRYPIIHHVM